MALIPKLKHPTATETSSLRTSSAPTGSGPDVEPVSFLEGTVPRSWSIVANSHASSASGHVEVSHPDLSWGCTLVQGEMDVALAGIDQRLACGKFTPGA